MLLREKDKVLIHNLAKKTLQTPMEIWVYGSRVNGEAHDTSDLDLVLCTKTQDKIAIGEFIAFKEALRESNLPIFVQVMDWNRIPESFHKNILSNYEVLYNEKTRF